MLCRIDRGWKGSETARKLLFEKALADCKKAAREYVNPSTPRDSRGALSFQQWREQRARETPERVKRNQGGVDLDDYQMYQGAIHGHPNWREDERRYRSWRDSQEEQQRREQAAERESASRNARPALLKALNALGESGPGAADAIPLLLGLRESADLRGDADLRGAAEGALTKIDPNWGRRTKERPGS